MITLELILVPRLTFFLFKVPLASIWINFFDHTSLLNLVDIMLANLGMSSPAALALLQEVLVALRKLTASDVSTGSALKERLPGLLSLRPILAEADVLDE